MARAKISEQAAALIGSVLPIYRAYVKSKRKARPVLSSSERAGLFAVSLYIGERDECFYLICLDGGRRLITAELVSRGTVDEAAIYPRQIVDAAIKHGAVSVVLSHNHPSGLLAASGEDIASTRSLISALTTVQIDVLDHIIVAGDDYLSFSEKRMLNLIYE
jgi:DNA repair protein RadC